MFKQDYQSKSESYTCSTCSATFTEANLFVDHVTNGHKDDMDTELLCPQCPLSFDRTQDLKIHMQSVHHTIPNFSVQAQPIKPNLNLLNTPNATQSLFCPKCKNPFANKYSLMKHLRTTKCKLSDEASINRVINEQLTCPKCKHQFGSVQALNKHFDTKKCLVNEVEPQPQPIK